MEPDCRVIDRRIDELLPELEELARRIHEHPELRFEEHRAAAWVAEFIEKWGGVAVERGVGGLPTALRAETGSAGAARVALFAEYDALPEIGHACGHNLIAAGAVGAFVALTALPHLPGRVELFGTPAEEGGGGKIRLLEAGAFDGLDAALMFHPFDRDLLAHPALASSWVRMQFAGAPSHAAMAPWEGRSALTACLETFHLIDAQRVHFRDGVRVHGIVLDGGQAVNVIPERAVAEFSVRAPTSTELERVRTIVERCARGAATACGVDVTLSVRAGYKEMNNNMTIAERFGAALSDLGRPALVGDATVGAGSTDMGDVSHAVPSIHPWLAICDQGATTCHQHAFAAAAISPRGLQTMAVAAKALARTALELLHDGELLAAAKAEHAAARRAAAL